MNQAPTPFVEYPVPGVGTVIDPEGEPGYRVRLPDGRVTAYPAHSGEPSEANAAADIAYAIAHPVVVSPRWRVLKDTLWMRCKERDLQPAAVAAISSLPTSQRLDWDAQSWFWSDNAAIRAVLAEIGASAEQVEEILAPDPLAP